MRRTLGIALIFLVALDAEALDTQFLQTLRDTHYSRIESEAVGRPFHIYTMLPDSYGEHPEQRFPTVYILDGGALFPLLSAYYRYLLFDGEIRDAIIVGISYGSNNFGGGNYRSTDFTAASDEREWYGGAGNFQRFLRDELVPSIEARYRSDAGRRIVFGHSLGGQFVLYTAQTLPDLFWGHIASNPALHRNLDFFLAQRPESVSNSRLFVANGSDNDERFKTPLHAWEAHWSKETDKPWDFRYVEFEGHTHMSTPPEAFRQGLSWLYAVESRN